MTKPVWEEMSNRDHSVETRPWDETAMILLGRLLQRSPTRYAELMIGISRGHGRTSTRYRDAFGLWNRYTAEQERFMRRAQTFDTSLIEAPPAAKPADTSRYLQYTVMPPRQEVRR